VSIGSCPPPRAAARPEARWHFPSASDPGKVHVTTRHADGTWGCMCWGFCFARRADGECLHIDAGRAADRPLTVLDVLGRDRDDIVVR
jgi:hypothetical protein